MLGDVIRALRNRASLTQKEVADKIKVSVDTVKRWEKNEREPRYTELQKIATALGVSVAELLSDENPEAVKVEQERSAEAANLKPITGDREEHGNARKREEVVWVPVVDRIVSASAGKGNYYDGVEWNVVYETPVSKSLLTAYSWQGASFFVYYADGDSMEPYIHDGDSLLVAENVEVVNGNVAVVSLNGALFVKGVMLNKDGSATLVSFNKNYPDRKIILDEVDFKIIGKVIKSFPVNNVPNIV
ncbi:MAG: S24 family peptidase [Synergistaceae bacterium]|nr:S24 family peptidase [Synergistaceae bacterium]